MTAILITQCLQNDFVKPYGLHEIVPNKLHIGHREAERLIGIRPNEGPVGKLMDWAYMQEENALQIIHIRDWHDKDDLSQQKHLKQFGNHCLRDTEGAEFVFKDTITNDHHVIINASGLNDFVDTNLPGFLDQYKDEEVKVGLIGVWTDAKISFLAYELVTRYPHFKVALCSALTASSPTSTHFIALERLEKLLDVEIYSSIGDFTSFLTGTIPDYKKEAKSYGARLEFDGDHSIDENDKELIQYLFRESKTATFKVLDGGFSGNVVLKSQSVNVYGHKEVSAVVKVGPRKLIAKERDAFERIKDVLGNNAPSIIDYAEDENRGAIKYRYAAMYGDAIQTFQSFYMDYYHEEKIKAYLDVIFQKQLGRLYEAGRSEKLDLLAYYDFSPKYADVVANSVEEVLGQAPQGDFVDIEGHRCYNVVQFYKEELGNLDVNYQEQHFMAFVHGDLNGANILIDGQENIWLIDFFHTHYGHILRDLIKLENDLLFIFTRLNSKDEFEEALKLIDCITEVPDLAYPPLNNRFTYPVLNHALATIIQLRSYYADLIETIRDPYQYYVSMLRYSIHTLSFEESNLWQKKLALYMSSICAKKIVEKHKSSRELRLDFLSGKENFKGKEQIALTLLPGRKDMKRNLTQDLNIIRNAGIDHVLTLVTFDELNKHGVNDLFKQLNATGISSLHIPIKDQGNPSLEEIDYIFNWLDKIIEANKKVLIHCVGGLGRSGTVAALYLKKKNHWNAQKAIDVVRQSRSPRAIESKEQIYLVEDY
jgi:nicotinamidase-related amidase